MKKYSTKLTRKQLEDLYDMIEGVFEITEITSMYDRLLLSVLYDLKNHIAARLIEVKPTYKFTFSKPYCMALMVMYYHYDFDISPGSNKLSLMAAEVGARFY